MSDEKPMIVSMPDIKDIVLRADGGDRHALAQLYGLAAMRVLNSENIPVEEKAWLAERLEELKKICWRAAMADKDPAHMDRLVAKAAGIHRAKRGRRKVSRVAEMKKGGAALLQAKPFGQEN
jgi:hypothetical protein